MRAQSLPQDDQRDSADAVREQLPRHGAVRQPAECEDAPALGRDDLRSASCRIGRRQDDVRRPKDEGALALEGSGGELPCG